LRKTLCFLPMMLLLLLCGCESRRQVKEPERIQEFYRQTVACQMQADVRCQYDDAVRQYSFLCSWTPEESTVEVTAPAELAGIRAILRGENLLLEYRGMSLDAGALSSQEIAPVQALPLLLRALQQGYVTGWCRETLDGKESIHLTLDESGREDGKIYYDLWLDEDDRLLAGEIRAEERVLFTCRIQAFTSEQEETAPPQ